MCFTHSFFHFATLRKSLQTTSTSPYRCMVTDFVSFIYNLKECFEQPAASFLVCSLIFIEY
ncbi:DNA or RNA helicases of superfamily II [Streptococcus pneumoniae]|nr:DNA or RNA helicases of superfamily II [Streptococcus pneumoniae]